MPDNPLPPWWGPAPFDERDLDALLSGETTDIPELRPVADALAALQAEPMPAELRGQAIIMAEFRAAGLAQDSRAGDAAQTLVLSGPQERLGHRSAPRHRGRRRTTPVASWRTGTLISAVAVAAVVLAVVLTGNVPGPFQHLVNPSAITWGNSSSPKVQGSATPEPTPPPASASLTPQQVEANSLCNIAYNFVQNPGHSAGWRQDTSLLQQLQQLINLAGGLGQVRDYCAPWVGDLFPNGIPKAFSHLPGLDDQGSGFSQVGQDR
jgi:hypothetical protein